MSPKADTESAAAKREALLDEVRRDCLHMAAFRQQHWADDGSRWTSLRMLDCMIQTFTENREDDPDGSWERRLDVAHQLRREMGRVLPEGDASASLPEGSPA